MDAEMAELFKQQLMLFTLWEGIAILLGLAYVLMAARELPWAWPAALVSTGIYTVLFWEGNLPMQSAVNVIYMAMAVYGWTMWRARADGSTALTIHRWNLGRHAAWISLGVLLTFGFGGMLSLYNASPMPYLDAGVMVFSMMTTFLMARKVLENWFYWIVINTFAVALYWQLGYPMTALMFVAYMGLAWYGMINWQIRWRQQQ